MAYNIGIIGTGYVGLVTGTVFADTGNNVTCVDIDEEKINTLRKGETPIYEPLLEGYLKKNIRQKRLHFTLDLEETVKSSNIIFLCLPTPPNEDGSADLQHVLKVAGEIADYIIKNKITDKKIVVNKSTVPVGTAAKVTEIFSSKLENNNVVVVSNPEFLREGFAVEDALKPERVVVGTTDEYAVNVMSDLYKPFLRSGNPVYFMDEKSAEVTKYAANSFLATKISFMNDLSGYCERVGADIDSVRLGIGSDSRIGKRFLFAGIGYGGSCFPKDVRALIYSSVENEMPLDIIRAAQDVNKKQIKRFFKKIDDRYNGNLEGVKFALWGLAFKPNTDDTREAPAFDLIDMMLEKGAQIRAFDPEAMPNTGKRFGDKIEYADDIYSCMEGADSLIIATEWNDFRNPDFEKVRGMLARPLIFDGRNVFTLEEMEESGFEYYSVGRRAVVPGI
jgi:UDPglucose 6-dehydrogenase